MKSAALLLVCLATVALTLTLAYSVTLDEEGYVVRRGADIREKPMPGGYLIRKTAVGRGKFRCECLKNRKKVKVGRCGSHSDCI